MTVLPEPSIMDFEDEAFDQLEIDGPDRSPGDEPFKVPGDNDFGSYDWLKSSKLSVIGAGLVHRFKNIRHLEGWRVRYYWRKAGGTKQRRKHFGDCQVTSGLFRQEVEVDYVIWLAADHCQGMTRREIEATLYEQLCHAGVDKDGNRVYQSADVNTFTAVIQAFGAQTPEQRIMGRVFQQLPLIAGLPDVDTGEEEE